MRTLTPHSASRCTSLMQLIIVRPGNIKVSSPMSRRDAWEANRREAESAVSIEPLSVLRDLPALAATDAGGGTPGTPRQSGAEPGRDRGDPAAEVGPAGAPCLRAHALLPPPLPGARSPALRYSGGRRPHQDPAADERHRARAERESSRAAASPRIWPDSYLTDGRVQR